MRDVLVGLAVLACPLGMGVMMWMMGKGMRLGGAKRGSAPAPTADELREEHRRLGVQIDRMRRDETQHPDPVRR